MIKELVEDENLAQVSVEGWGEPGYAPAGFKVPRSVDVRSLIAPFDELLGAADVRFGFVQRLGQQLYVPAQRREFGYYVLPFIVGDQIVGRCDLKADRQRSALLVQSAYLELGHPPAEVASELVAELRDLARWLELNEIRVADKGDLASLLLKATR